MGHLGFSYVGMIYLFMLFIPNIIWSKNQPAEYEYKNENRILIIFERIGQVLVSCTVLIFSDFNIHSFSVWSIWLILSFAFMLIYEYWWIRYFKSHKTLKDFYSSIFGIPVAGATLPILAFLFLGIYGNVIWLVISTIILGIGHIGIHLNHLKDITD
ncbi:hypothetical protein [uncultured Anaerofustis sp.]|uniref:hypothetical protein n=1 Tax=uncultured Anaerofustis sp. TaxID=904996 RepID=UPI0025D00DBA|nr:hypothetical protein [uncultured Anaerofustis sp.]